MAERAIRWKPRGDMVWVCSPIEIRLMTRVAGSRRVDVVVVDMALSACERGVRTCQRVICKKGVVEFGVEPVHCRMASGTVVREAELDMRRIL